MAGLVLKNTDIFVLFSFLSMNQSSAKQIKINEEKRKIFVYLI
jgi:hypothetical protein